MAGVMGRALAQAVPGAMEERLAATEASTADLVGAVDTMFVLFSAYLVFFMQAGFAMVSPHPPSRLWRRPAPALPRHSPDVRRPGAANT